MGLWGDNETHLYWHNGKETSSELCEYPEEVRKKLNKYILALRYIHNGILMVYGFLMNRFQVFFNKILT